MTQQEYEQKKRECWQEFYKKYPYHITLSSSIIFAETFDRAYALGKQEIKQETKQEKDAGINGEEMLTVPKKKVQELLQHCEDILSMMPTDSSASFLKYRLLKFLEANIDSPKPQDFGRKVNFPTKEKPTCTDECSSPRLQIAAQLLAGLLAGGKEKYPVSRALGLADFLIAAEKGDQS